MRYPHRRESEIQSHFLVNWDKEDRSSGDPQIYQDILDEIGRTEKRRNSRLWREFVIALPIEGDDCSRSALTESFAKILARKYNIVLSASIHHPPRRKTGNHHAHLLATTRMVDRRYGRPRLDGKNRELDARVTLFEIRKIWEDCLNSYYSALGLDKRVSCESNKDRGIAKIPTIHEGPQSKVSSGERRKINRTITRLNAAALINATSVAEAMEMIPAYMDSLEKELAEKKAKEKKLLEEIERSLRELRLTERQRKQLKTLLDSVRKVIVEHDNPLDVAEALKEIVLRGGTGGGMFDRLRRSLPPKGGDREIVWARDGISLLSSLFASPDEETLAKIREWTAGPHLWVPSPNPPVDDGKMTERVLDYLHEENEFMPPEEEDPAPPPI
jgi:hypothetical protein